VHFFAQNVHLSDFLCIFAAQIALKNIINENINSMAKILGLDMGTNSIGWAILDTDEKKFLKTGSRIIPMDAATMGDYEKGNLESAAKARTGFRGMRRLYERSKLRRQRLLRVLNILGFLPEHFRNHIDFDNRLGQFKDDSEPLIAHYRDNNGKMQFLYRDAFQEMLSDFRKHQPELIKDGKLIPEDWTIYYLRNKALTQPISGKELAWILLNFNAKRGYYQLKGEEEEDDVKPNKIEEYMTLKVDKVNQIEPNKKRQGYYWYEIIYENGCTQKATGPVPPRKAGDLVEVIVTTEIDENGNVKITKDGDKKIKLRAPKEDDWTLLKKRTEFEIGKSGCTVGSYIYQNILKTPETKIRGKLVRTIERKFYKDELYQILEKQKEYIPELQDTNIYKKCVRELYRNNEAHVESISSKDFTSLFVDDIIFYQRPLKSKKSLISDCPYEWRTYKNQETGEIEKEPIKCTPKSNPLYEEFRLWQLLSNLRIFKREIEVDGKLRTDYDITSTLLKSKEDVANLYDWLCDKKEITQNILLKYPGFALKKTSDYRWNYVEDKAYPCCNTTFEINKRLAKVEKSPILEKESIKQLWHIIYSINDPTETQKALGSFARKHNIDEESFISNFKKIAFEKEYGAYSEKAIRKLLTLMRMGHHWNEEAIDPQVMQRINNIIDGVADDSISTRAREKSLSLQSVNDFQGLPLWLACYAIYNRHSEANDITRWQTPEDIDYYLQNHFKQHSLRNPIVEQVLGETLRVVRDIWKKYGKIDEIHVEMGRDLKKDAKGRQKAHDKVMENERTNLRIRLLLQELASPDMNVEGVRPHSPSQQEILKIFEDGILSDPSRNSEIPDDIRTIINDLGSAGKAEHISHSDVLRYRLWLEQKYLSPYTGQPIPLSKLFTTDYQIEHVIPQSRYYDDSLSNKVICESEVNKEKDRMLGYEFITQKGGMIIKGNGGKDIKVFDKEQYEDFVKQHYSGNRTKMRNLLMDDIPEGFVQRQINDTRYMSRKIISVLSNLVRDEDEQEATSKHIIPTIGSITDRLKKEWGLNDVWNDIIAPRFQRLNELTNSNDYGEWVNKEGKRYFQINIPLEISAGFSKKRIDHRHHAMDAMVIACCTRDIVNYLNNSLATDNKKDLRYDLRNKLCTKYKTDNLGNYVWVFNKPWETFTQDVKYQLQNIIVSFKQNLRIINKMSNYYQHYVDGKKVIDKQTKGDGWAIRKSLHKATVSGAVSLQRKKTVKLSEALKDWKSIADKELRNEIKRLITLYNGFDAKTITKYFKDREYKLGKRDISKVETYYYTSGKEALSATRVSIDVSFDEKKIMSITDSGIQKIMLKHLHNYDDAAGKSHPEIAFSPEGIATMNDNLKTLNDGKEHKPIYKVRKTETLGAKFPVGESAAKKKKLVEADKGTNLFFAIYADKDNSRSYESIPLNVAVERLKNHLPVADYTKGESKLMFVLSPNDLVYIPDMSGEVPDVLDISRIYKMVSFTGNELYFVGANVANVIKQGFEFGSLNKIQTLNSINLKSVCVKIIVDRLGFITKIYKDI